MLFTLDEERGKILPVDANWNPKELDLERYLVTHLDDDVPVLSEYVFGEPLLLISNQVRTRNNKRADILALDRAGQGVIIELKRNDGRLGVETQALQYLADFSAYSGYDFLRRFSKNKNVTEEILFGFAGDGLKLEGLNRKPRVILVARDFDESVFSIGEWLSSKGVAFRCISYTPVELLGQRMLSFSIAFDRSPDALYPLAFSQMAREPGYFWHNIARADESWWQHLVESEEIPACFENRRDDLGEKLLKRYVTGDTIIAYAKGFGAVGWGVIADANSYQLVQPGSKRDQLNGNCLHRLSIKWRSTARSLRQAVTAEYIRNEFGIYHPISTSVSIATQSGRRLTRHLDAAFSANSEIYTPIDGGVHADK